MFFLSNIIELLCNSVFLTGYITGNNTFYGANKSKTLDGILSKYTVALAIIFPNGLNISSCFVVTNLNKSITI